ncbi:hypothetical protein [Phytohabitans houttuyneae]|uniref:Uncharacterized protein n=1 Tax=Phytohabitans houttuyneae TaxID=1076126 RepID=A0A6V8KDQ1_9ACTN|nr:hypothetical protein [Phytohabitans houttuyneae]GFJ83372.1 hypothetical protein Phou_075520 [Phytohabitans houttuyneae]
MASPPAGDSVAARYAAAMRVGVVAIMLVWHFCYDVLIIVRSWSEYTSRPAAVGAWLIVSVVQVVGSVLLLRGSGAAAHVDRLLAAAAVGASVLAIFSYPPGQALSDLSWAWNTVGWCGVLLLMHRPLWELVVMQAANAAITVVAVAADGSLDRVMTGRLVIVGYATVGVQMLFAVVSHHLNGVARRATELTLARADHQARAAIDEAVHAERQRRYREVRERIEPIVRGLADGTLDPVAPEVRRIAGVEAARLRRLFAETDDSADPLLHELRACTDLAERRGVEVTFFNCGRLPEVPTVARRYLTEVVLLVLASAVSRARLTVVADAAEVIVSVIADAPADVLDDLREVLPVSVVHDQDANQLWVEVRWRKPPNLSGSASSTTTRSSLRGSAPG